MMNTTVLVQQVLLMTLQNAPPGLDLERDKKFSKVFSCLVTSSNLGSSVGVGCFLRMENSAIFTATFICWKFTELPCTWTFQYDRFFIIGLRCISFLVRLCLTHLLCSFHLQSFKEMIAMCLVKDPSKRPSAEKLLRHSFFKHARSFDYIARHVLEGLPPLGERVKNLKVPPQKKNTKSFCSCSENITLGRSDC